MKITIGVTIAVLLLLSGGWCPAVSGTFSLRDVPDPGPEEKTRPQSFERMENWAQGTFLRAQGEPSMKRAILYSLLLPGLGEHYAGHDLRARTFFAIEAGVWTSFAVLRTQGYLREKRYKDFAVQFAGLTSTGHSDDFYKTIGTHASSDAYEADLKSEGRVEIWPNVGYEALEQYYEANRISDFEEWAWSSFDRRIEYRELRSSSRLAYRRSFYMLAAAAANRIASALSVYQLVKSGRPDGEAQAGRYFLEFGSPGRDDRGEYKTGVTLIRTF